MYQNDNQIDYTKLTDDELICLAQAGDNAASGALCLRYKNLVRIKVRPYYIIGADRDDIVQEGMIGLFKATRDYSSDKAASFRTFAELCIDRQAITAINMARRRKHAPLNEYVSLSQPLNSDDPDKTLVDIMPSHIINNPEDIVISNESVTLLIHNIKTSLTPLEYNVLVLFMEGLGYQEIAKRLGRSSKAIDNALQRVKKKVSKFIAQDEV